MQRLMLAAMLMALLLSGCAQPGGGYSSDGAIPYDGYDPAAESRAPHRYYPPPGPSGDPWGPYIHEAASRFRVPEQWVRAVMHQESGGQEQAVSPVGAMGLMQVMPQTYAGLKQRHRLGNDPYDPHNNILAGTAYIREMYDRYGAPGFLAAYNAGPDRLDAYLAGNSELPDETINYLASITPHLGNAIALTGPLATYGVAEGAAPSPAPSVTSLAAGCDENAAYDPDHPCAPLERAATAPVQQVAAAYTAPPPPDVPGTWGIQVGAFGNPGLAREVAETARMEDPEQLRAATITLPTTAPSSGTVLYRSRLANLSAGQAALACQRLNQRQLPCVVVQPSGL